MLSVSLSDNVYQHWQTLSPLVGLWGMLDLLVGPASLVIYRPRLFVVVFHDGAQLQINYPRPSRSTSFPVF
ncbi:hypothetical protein BDZ89DRAFT_57875 [Hymenopellis radicata]|nr:hypothetical protein BDZ89DRAFT_57875 [Hymenopellis radicata]